MMVDMQTDQPQILSTRPDTTRVIMDQTGLDPAMLRDLVHRFYGKIRADSVLGPIFASRITDWTPHLDRMVAFWSSVALMTGEYHGAPVPAHAHLPVTWAHFDRWLDLFRETAHEICPPAGAAHVIDRAERFALSLHIAVKDAGRTDSNAVPNLR